MYSEELSSSHKRRSILTSVSMLLDARLTGILRGTILLFPLKPGFLCSYYIIWKVQNKDMGQATEDSKKEWEGQLFCYPPTFPLI